MARSFRYYGKKRGHRRTGSPAWGSLGEAAFWAMFLLLGCGGTIVLFSYLVVPEWRVNHQFLQTTCKVLDKRIVEKPGEDGPLYRPEIKIEYEGGGVVYRNWQHDSQWAFSSGRDRAEATGDRSLLYNSTQDDRHLCWYDPQNPEVVVLTRGYRWWVWPAFTVPLSFVVIGTGGLIYALLRWGKSAERRAALTKRVVEQDIFGTDGNGRGLYPFVPQGADVTNSPGTRLRFRLPMAASPGRALLGMLAFCLFVNGVASVLLLMAVRSFIAGRPDWFSAIFSAPLLLIGLGAIGALLWKLLVATGVGPTLLEISDHPLYCSRQYRLFLSQSGRLRVTALSVSLVCREDATYRQGTNSRTEAREVYRQELFRREGFAIESGAPFETELDFNVPERAMHSFKADHNEINWMLTVEGDVARWPNYKRCFPVVVRPANKDAD